MSAALHSVSIPVTSARIASADGATAEVHWNGAHVTSWRPAPGNRERLFLSRRTGTGDGVAIRGGIPVIFPQFAAEGPLPRHGFARVNRWEIEEQTEAGVLGFTLRDSDATRALWPASFLATLTVRIGGRQLSTTLSVQNTGPEPFHFTAALHTYLRVNDIAKAEIVGLHGARYRVSSAPGEFLRDDEDVLRIHGEVDRVYVDAPSRLTLREPGRELHVDTTNFPDAVIWNPGAEKAAALDDMEVGGERHMLCIEAGAIQSPVQLEPGHTWSGTQTLVAMIDADGEREFEAALPPMLGMAPAARQDLADKLQQMEAFVTQAEASGEEVPPELAAVVKHLRQMMNALDGLTKDLGG
ncbi:MAG: D-hexose-6-phosphate mutarotase [Gemmatimonadota bacterium]|nr:D-hexose-6-phosphate mutarotase [Gemmatimonadota bacterium]